ncbi:SDR family oxidoreductase [Halobacillus mangrovi]|uniref:3-oxoacyl-ACP reductase n=1 Tax=Halobacillus mangrovi TaxID=402384 RepID=A0A1W5ZX92_9BACI|nr:SDR family oxidoreductase [Halobacillus mangrovi]ARI77928.1 3-oxoacyl-ACP reductase [Halobacillus mangrovi]
MNKVALVTGGSKGLGKAIALTLGEQGNKVIVNFNRNAEKAKLVIDDGGEAVAIQADITQEDEVKRLASEAENLFQEPITILVNNATGPQPELSLQDVSWEDYLDQLHFTVKAPLLLTKELMGGMQSKKWGRIINIGSEVVELGNPHFSNYVTAKSSVIGMTRSWANELGGYGITVNTVHPGFIPVERHGEVTEESAKGYVQHVPLKKLGKPKDIANTVGFLCSDEAEFITGQNINVNGGNTFGV